MAASVNFTPVLLTLLSSFFLALYLHIHCRQQRRLVPGPKGRWLLGNATQIPVEKPWLWYMKLHEEHGTSCYKSTDTHTDTDVL